MHQTHALSSVVRSMMISLYLVPWKGATNTKFFKCSLSARLPMCIQYVAFCGSDGFNWVHTAAIVRGWRKDFNSTELTLYIGCLRSQLRSVPRPYVYSKYYSSSLHFSLVVCPRSQPFPYFSDSISH